MSKIFESSEKGLFPIFVYGTLMNPKTRDFVLKHKEYAQKAILPGYRRLKFKTPEGIDFPTIEPKEHVKISGDLILVSKEDFNKLKEWEDEYDLKSIKLSNGMEAHTFILKNKDKLKKE